MKLYYRISDKSYPKNKLIGATKEVCLMNFVKAFFTEVYGQEKPDENYVPSTKIICDNCERKTIRMIQDTGLPWVITEEGNAGSLWEALKLAMEEGEDDDIVYFCEDDYLHLPSSPQLLREGLEIADYVTLYDHPDKYSDYYSGGEICKVFKTESSHWRNTISTCMTFGTKVGTLKKDIHVWEEHTTGDHPHDHTIFIDLRRKERMLAVCIPGAACHTDLAFSEMVGKMTIEQWAISMMVSHIHNECQELAVPAGKADEYIKLTSAIRNKSLPEQLVLIDAIHKSFKTDLA